MIHVILVSAVLGLAPLAADMPLVQQVPTAVVADLPADREFPTALAVVSFPSHALEKPLRETLWSKV